jgi:hypothetical protein
MQNLSSVLDIVNTKRADPEARCRALAGWLYRELAKAHPDAVIARQTERLGPLRENLRGNMVFFDVGIDQANDWLRIHTHKDHVSATAYDDGQATPMRITKARWTATEAVAALRMAQAAAQRHISKRNNDA